MEPFGHRPFVYLRWYCYRKHKRFPCRKWIQIAILFLELYEEAVKQIVHLHLLIGNPHSVLLIPYSGSHEPLSIIHAFAWISWSKARLFYRLSIESGILSIPFLFDRSLFLLLFLNVKVKQLIIKVHYCIVDDRALPLLFHKRKTIFDLSCGILRFPWSYTSICISPLNSNSSISPLNSKSSISPLKSLWYLRYC